MNKHMYESGLLCLYSYEIQALCLKTTEIEFSFVVSAMFWGNSLIIIDLKLHCIPGNLHVWEKRKIGANDY